MINDYLCLKCAEKIGAVGINYDSMNNMELLQSSSCGQCGAQCNNYPLRAYVWDKNCVEHTTNKDNNLILG